MTHSNKRYNILNIILSIAISIVVLILCIAIGSIDISPSQGLNIIFNRLLGVELASDINATMVTILWNIRIPRVLVSFLVGASLSVSGVIMQAVLRNPLASSYTLGVSSGASVGVAIIMVFGISVEWLGHFLMPIAGFVCGFVTVLIVMAMSMAMDRTLKNQTVILVGMVLSLFLNAIITLIASFFRDYSTRIYSWQMGSFGGRNWTHVVIIFVVLLISAIILMALSREMDIITFGEEQGTAIGVNVRRCRFILLVIASILTGVSVCFSGIIGFIDLIAPHVVRRIFGPGHKLLIPMSILYGGSFMAIADFLSRTLISPREIAVGAVTAIIGAPFFGYVYMKRRAR